MPASPEVSAPVAVQHNDVPPLQFHPIDQPDVMAAPALESNGTL
jgi:hypothetical protein